MALATADDSLCRQKHGAVVVRSGNVLVRAVNVDRNSPMIMSESHIKAHASVHAEIAAIRQIKNPARCVLYVARRRKDGLVGMSKPCRTCQNILSALGVRVVYTVSNLESR